MYVPVEQIDPKIKVEKTIELEKWFILETF